MNMIVRMKRELVQVEEACKILNVIAKEKIIMRKEVQAQIT